VRAGPGGDGWEPAIPTTSSESRDFHRAKQAIPKIKIRTEILFTSFYCGVRQSMIKGYCQNGWQILFPSDGFDMKLKTVYIQDEFPG